MQSEWIIINEYCEKCHIDPAFIILLEEGGLLDVHDMAGERYFPASQLRDVEQYSRMYYDLSINMEGIDAIRHLLARIEGMKQEIQHLKDRLHIYEPDF